MALYDIIWCYVIIYGILYYMILYVIMRYDLSRIDVTCIYEYLCNIFNLWNHIPSNVLLPQT